MKIVQVGTGGWGKNHARVLSQLGVLSAICDANLDRSKEFGEKYSVKSYSNINDLIQNENFDGAVICTPTITHYEIASKMINNKKHVFVEKPLSYRSEEGEKLVDLAKKNKVILTCGYIERFNPAVALVKEILAQKRFGDLVMLEFHRENRMPLHIKDVGIIYDTSVHDIDTAMWLFNETPNLVFAISGKIKHEHEDFASIMLGFKENKFAIITSNWITPVRVRTFNAVCTEANIFSDFISQEIKIEKDKDTEIPRNEKKEPLSLELQNFLNAINEPEKLIVRPNQAVNVTKIAEAALLSSQKGVPIYMDLK